REGACAYAAMGERVEQLAAMLDRGRALAQRGFERPARPRAEAADAFALRSDAAAMCIGIRAQARGEPRGCVCQPLAAAQPRDGLRASSPLAERNDELGATVDATPQDLRAEPAGDAREPRVMDLRIGGERAGQARAGLIEPLPRQRQQLLGRRQTAARGAQLAASCLLPALPAGETAPREAFDAHGKL